MQSYYTPSDLIRVLRRYLVWKPANLPLGFHEANLYTSVLDQLLHLPRAEDGRLYIITPCPLEVQQQGYCRRRVPGGYWEFSGDPKRLLSANGSARLFSFYTGVSTQQFGTTDSCMWEYTLDDRVQDFPTFSLCVICTRAMIQSEEAKADEVWGSIEMSEGSSDSDNELEDACDIDISEADQQSRQTNNQSSNWDEACLDDAAHRLQQCTLKQKDVGSCRFGFLFQ